MFKITTCQKFDVGIMVIILLNMFTMAMEHYEQPDELTQSLGIVNGMFIAIFTVECFMKIIALRLYYFKQPWNVFDFIVVFISILGNDLNFIAIIFIIIITTMVLKFSMLARCPLVGRRRKSPRTT